jgi:dTDP-4-dehydrorhamnose reductase
MHREVAAVAAASAVPSVLFSSWMVFAGSDRSALDEDATPDAVSSLGRAWIASEDAVLRTHPATLVARLGPALGSPAVADVPRAEDAASVPAVTPSLLADAVNAALDLMIDRERGVWHLPNVGLAPVTPGGGIRRSVVLASRRGLLLPPVEDALRRVRAVQDEAPRDGRDAAVADAIPA